MPRIAAAVTLHPLPGRGEAARTGHDGAHAARPAGLLRRLAIRATHQQIDDRPVRRVGDQIHQRRMRAIAGERRDQRTEGARIVEDG